MEASERSAGSQWRFEVKVTGIWDALVRPPDHWRGPCVTAHCIQETLGEGGASAYQMPRACGGGGMHRHKQCQSVGCRAKRTQPVVRAERQHPDEHNNVQASQWVG